MKVKVLLFAAPREQVGKGEIELELPEKATVQELQAALKNAHPALRSPHLRFAVNRRYATPDTTLHDGDEIACIPPVGGG